MIHTFPVIALPHLLPYQPSHHALDPLLTDYGVLRGFKRFVVVVVYAVKSWWNFRLRGLEGLGFWGWHGDGVGGGRGRTDGLADVLFAALTQPYRAPGWRRGANGA